MSLGDYGDISRALADYFETGGVLDLVPSDVAAGFLVLGTNPAKTSSGSSTSSSIGTSLGGIHKDDKSTTTTISVVRFLIDTNNTMNPMISRRGSSRSRQATTYLMQQEGSQTFYEVQTRSVLSRHKPVDLEVLAEGARFSRYALAIYTWGLYVYSHPLTGPPRLVCNKLVCCSCCRINRHDDDDEEDEQALLQESGQVHGDNCMETNKSALLLHAGLDDESDLVYAQFQEWVQRYSLLYSVGSQVEECGCGHSWHL